MIKKADEFQDLQGELASWTQESQSYSSSLKANRLEANEEPIFQSESKGRKKVNV